jgi:hypothetical protein
LAKDPELRIAQLRYIRDDIVMRRVAFGLACVLALVGMILMILHTSLTDLLVGAGTTAIGAPLAYYFGRRTRPR